MAVCPGSLIPKAQLALFANKVWKLLITSFSSVLGSKKTLNPFGTSWKPKLEPEPCWWGQIVDFINNLDQHKKVLPFLGGLQLPFDDLTANSIKRFVAAAVGKIYKIRTEKLHELGAPWLND